MFLALVVWLSACWLSYTAAWAVEDLQDVEYHFNLFMQQYNRQYKDEIEKQARFEIFKANIEEAMRMNEKSTSAVFGVTKFSDLTLEEFEKYYTGLKIGASNHTDSCKYLTDADILDTDAPESFDWRDHNVVTRVKNQKSCGSCYAFSSTGNIEGQYFLKYNKTILLSEQQIVDCDKRENHCHGGAMSNVFSTHITYQKSVVCAMDLKPSETFDVAVQWSYLPLGYYSMQFQPWTLIEDGGSESETDYPYEGTYGECKFDASKVKVKLADCRSYNLTSQEKVKNLLYHNGPISIAIKGHALHKYTTKGGIISDELCDEGFLSHAVLLVGYGTENGNPYWIVKNSWNISWGEHGYFRMHRGEGASSCAMMNDYMASSIVA